MTLIPNIKKVTSLLLLVLVAFICIHDGGFALIALMSEGSLSDLAAQNDCGGTACSEAESCQCPVHLLEKLDEMASVTCIAMLPPAKHVPVTHEVLASRVLSPSEPPPKA